MRLEPWCPRRDAEVSPDAEGHSTSWDCWCRWFWFGCTRALRCVGVCVLSGRLQFCECLCVDVEFGSDSSHCYHFVLSLLQASYLSQWETPVLLLLALQVPVFCRFTCQKHCVLHRCVPCTICILSYIHLDIKCINVDSRYPVCIRYVHAYICMYVYSTHAHICAYSMTTCALKNRERFVV